jgi:hypothetical protein
MTFTKRKILAVVKRYDVPAEHYAEFVDMFGRPMSDRRYVASADRLYRKLGRLFIVVNNHFAHLRLTAALAA